MASTYSTNLKIELMGLGDQAGTWGTTTNTNIGTALEQAIVGYGNPIFTTDADLTITLTDSNASQVARNFALNVTSSGSLTATRNLIVPTLQKQYLIQNSTTGSQSIVVKTSAGTGITVPNGARTLVYVDGTNVVSQITQLPALTVSSTLGVTGAVTLSSTLDVTGVATLGTGAILNTPASATLTNATGLPLTTGVTGTLPVANGGTGAATIAANNVILGNGTSAVQVVAPSTSGNVLASNGTTWASAAPGQLKYDLYTSGATTWTAPAGVTRIKVICIGGGGGGGAGATSGPCCCSFDNGGNGGYGGIAVGIYTVVPGTGYVATVGAGGAGSTTTNGSPGATSSLGSLLSATGGGGGIAQGANGANGAGTSGVTGNGSVVGGAGGSFTGSLTRASGASLTAAVTWTAALNRVPGARGEGQSSSPNQASGGTGGAVYIEYIG